MSSLKVVCYGTLSYGYTLDMKSPCRPSLITAVQEVLSNTTDVEEKKFLRDKQKYLWEKQLLLLQHPLGNPSFLASGVFYIGLPQPPKFVLAPGILWGTLYCVCV